MTLRDFWWLLAGSAFTWAIASGVSKTGVWLDVAIFCAVGAFAVAVPLRGWFRTSVQDSYEDSTASFRRARVALRVVGTDGR